LENACAVPELFCARLCGKALLFLMPPNGLLAVPRFDAPSGCWPNEDTADGPVPNVCWPGEVAVVGRPVPNERWPNEWPKVGADELALSGRGPKATRLVGALMECAAAAKLGRPLWKLVAPDGRELWTCEGARAEASVETRHEVPSAAMAVTARMEVRDMVCSWVLGLLYWLGEQVHLSLSPRNHTVLDAVSPAKFDIVLLKRMRCDRQHKKDHWECPD
jgi:hypothetical protein